MSGLFYVEGENMSYNRKTNMYEGYIYKCTNLINNKIYIGQTIQSLNMR